MKISDRIEQAPACQVINLSENEMNLYHGAGWRLACFVDGKCVELMDVLNVEYNDDVHSMSAKSLSMAVGKLNEWQKNDHAEAWLVMCSCYQFCHPVPIKLGDALSMSRLAQVILDEIENFSV